MTTMPRLVSFCFSALIISVFVTAVKSDDGDSKDEEETYKNPLSKGFGDDIEWVKWDDAIETAMEKDKPIFLLIHKTWCHACKSLKLSFKQSSAQKALQSLSKYFVMVNVEDDEEPWEEEYKPDGKYIPRILFLDKNGDVLPEFKNEKAAYESYKYYYSSPADVMNSMKSVLKHFGVEVPEIKKKSDKKLKPAAAEDAKTGADAGKAKTTDKDTETDKKADKKTTETDKKADKKEEKKDKKKSEEKKKDKKSKEKKEL